MRRYKVLILHKTSRFALLDLDVPARSRGGVQSTENGRKFLDELCAPQGQDTPAAIVLIPADAKCGVPSTRVMDLAARLMRKGTARKRRRPRKVPRPNRATETARAKNAASISGKPAPVEPRPMAPVLFKGGEMVFYPDRVELCGVKILGDTGNGQCRAVLDVLKCRKSDGRYVRVGGEKLATELGAEGGIGTVTGCVRRIRLNATKRLREQLGLVVGTEDVIANDRRYGYCLKEWITVADAADAFTGSRARSDEPVTEPVSEPEDDTVRARRGRILAALVGGERLRVPTIAAKVEASVATVKRDLAALKGEGKVTFDGPPKSGRYRLVG